MPIWLPSNATVQPVVMVTEIQTILIVDKMRRNGVEMDPPGTYELGDLAGLRCTLTDDQGVGQGGAVILLTVTNPNGTIVHSAAQNTTASGQCVFDSANGWVMDMEGAWTVLIEFAGS